MPPFPAPHEAPAPTSNAGQEIPIERRARGETRPLSVRLEPAVFDPLEAEAKRIGGVTLTSLVNGILKGYLTS